MSISKNINVYICMVFVFSKSIAKVITQQFLTSSKPWSSQFWTQFEQLRTEAWKSQEFNGVWARDLAIPVRRSNQLTYEATNVGSWLFVSSNEPVKNGFEVIYEMFHILNSSKPWSLRSKLRWSWLTWFQIRSSIYKTFHISLHNSSRVSRQDRNQSDCRIWRKGFIEV